MSTYRHTDAQNEARLPQIIVPLGGPPSPLSFDLMCMRMSVCPCPFLHCSNAIPLYVCRRLQYYTLRTWYFESLIRLESVTALTFRFGHFCFFSRSIATKMISIDMHPFDDLFRQFFFQNLMYCPFVRAFCFIVHSVGNKLFMLLRLLMLLTLFYLIYFYFAVYFKKSVRKTQYTTKLNDFLLLKTSHQHRIDYE